MHVMQKRKLAVSAAACIIPFCMVCQVHAYADYVPDDEKIHIDIEKKQLTIDELKAMNYKVPVAMKLTKNVGENAAEFGIVADALFTYETTQEFNEVLQEYATFNFYGKDSVLYKFYDSSYEVWCGLASAYEITFTGDIGVLYMTVPDSAEVGDIYHIRYETEAVNYNAITSSRNSKKCMHFWKSFSTDYTENVGWTDGCIEIVDKNNAETTETESLSLRSGDINGDDIVDIRDVILINRAIFGKVSLTPEQNKAADINGDGMPDAEDSLSIMKYIVKLTDSLT